MSVTIGGIRFPTKRATQKDKKLQSQLPDGRWIAYGHKDYQNWGRSKGAKFLPKHLLHFDKKRRDSYHARHAKTAQKKYSRSWLAMHILW